jgi:hypothetical protein
MVAQGVHKMNTTRKFVLIALICMCVWTMGFIPAILGMAAWVVYIAICKAIIEKYK